MTPVAGVEILGGDEEHPCLSPKLHWVQLRSVLSLCEKLGICGGFGVIGGFEGLHEMN